MSTVARNAVLIVHCAMRMGRPPCRVVRNRLRQMTVRESDVADKGFLLVTMEPPPAFEEEFNAWYDTEHLPERLALPGFETARRFVCISGHPRYLAMYDLAH